MVLSGDQHYQYVMQSSSLKLESVKRSPPQELKLQPATVQMLELEKKKMNLPTITVIESSPIREYPPLHTYPASLPQTTLQSNAPHALSESHPLPMSSQDSDICKDTSTIEALIKATKDTFSKEDFTSENGEYHDFSLLSQSHQDIDDKSRDSLEDSNNNSPSKPKPSDLPPLKSLTITCPSSPLLQRHALLQAQKEAQSAGLKTSPPILRRNTPPKKSPPLFRTSLTESQNKSKDADGSTGSLSPILSRRFSGQGNTLLEKHKMTNSIDLKEGSLSPSTSINTITSESEKIEEWPVGEMEIAEKIVSSESNTIDLDMTVRSGMIDSMNVRKLEGKKNVTFLLDVEKQSQTPYFPDKENPSSDIDMSVKSAASSVKTSAIREWEQQKPAVKERKKKGPLGIVMGKAAIAARAVSSGAQRSASASSLSSRPKQPVASTRSAPKPETTPIRKHSHSQCVMGTSAAHTNRTGHVSCATCGRRRAASQTNVSSEPPTKQQAKGKQAPVRKTSDSYPRKSSDSSKNNSPREFVEPNMQKSTSKTTKKERRPFFV